MAKKKNETKGPKRNQPTPSLTMKEAETMTGGATSRIQTNALAAAMATGNLDLLHATRVQLGLAPAARPPANEE
jgi:hypothetical protein